MGRLSDTVAAIWKTIYGSPAPRGELVASPSAAPAPHWAARRYAAAQSSRLLSDWIAGASSANAELRQDLRKLRYRSRQQERDNPYFRKWLNILGRNVIGPHGISVRPMAMNGNRPDEYARELLAEAFAEWSKVGTCTVDGQLSRPDAERLIIRAVSQDGDTIIRHIRGAEAGNAFGYALQLMESDHLVEDDTFRTFPNGDSVFMGVQTNRYRRPMAFHLNERHYGEDSLNFGGRLNRNVVIPAREIVFPFVVDRPGQTRGVPWAHAAMIRLNDVGRYEEAEIVAARVASAKMGFFTSATGGEYVGDAKVVDAEGNEEIIREAEPGSFEQLPEGVDFKPFDPQHPTTAFEPFMSAMLHGTASGLDTSYAEMTGDLSGVNYSSIRQGALSDRDAWRVLQGWFIGRAAEPVWREWLLMALTTQAVRLPLSRYDELVKAKFHPRGWQWVDPAKEVVAAKEAIGLRIDSRTNVALQRGRDIRDVFEEIKREEELAEEMGIELSPVAPAPAPAEEPAEPEDEDEDEQTEEAEADE